MKLNATTWIIVTLAVTAWVFILPVKTVACILVMQLILLLYIKRSKTMLAAIGGLCVFTGMMIALQLLFGSPLACWPRRRSRASPRPSWTASTCLWNTPSC